MSLLICLLLCAVRSHRLRARSALFSWSLGHYTWLAMWLISRPVLPDSSCAPRHRSASTQRQEHLFLIQTKPSHVAVRAAITQNGHNLPLTVQRCPRIGWHWSFPSANHTVPAYTRCSNISWKEQTNQLHYKFVFWVYYKFMFWAFTTFPWPFILGWLSLSLSRKWLGAPPQFRFPIPFLKCTHQQKSLQQKKDATRKRTTPPFPFLPAWRGPKNDHLLYHSCTHSMAWLFISIQIFRLTLSLIESISGPKILIPSNITRTF